MLPGSVLLSSSLSRLHLAERMSELAGAAGGQSVLDRDCHHASLYCCRLFRSGLSHQCPAAAPDRSGATQSGTFRILDLLDVAVPQQWTRQLQVTHACWARVTP
ncbi:hypothetical protein [Deinococcus cavernae]|uniref:hypothetical protein n=1 Tax=Deinococcus cavernae TaxID=2320857 RepID=UPI001314C157|nr:hypothetical protein [Deinococcus cavernae]